MKIKLDKVLSAGKIYNSLKEEVIPIQLAYKFSRLFKSFKELEEFYENELNKLIEIYGERDEKNNLISTPEEGIKLRLDTLTEARKKINDLSNLEVDCADVTFSLEELSNLKIPFEQFNSLLPFIKEEKTED